jgi:hypothetical protein
MRITSHTHSTLSQLAERNLFFAIAPILSFEPVASKYPPFDTAKLRIVVGAQVFTMFHNYDPLHAVGQNAFVCLCPGAVTLVGGNLQIEAQKKNGCNSFLLSPAAVQQMLPADEYIELMQRNTVVDQADAQMRIAGTGVATDMWPGVPNVRDSTDLALLQHDSGRAGVGRVVLTSFLGRPHAVPIGFQFSNDPQYASRSGQRNVWTLSGVTLLPSPGAPAISVAPYNVKLVDRCAEQWFGATAARVANMQPAQQGEFYRVALEREQLQVWKLNLLVFPGDQELLITDMVRVITPKTPVKATPVRNDAVVQGPGPNTEEAAEADNTD